jgi:hypothetical protein
VDWQKYATQSSDSSEQATREARTLQELRAYVETYARLVEAIGALRKHGRKITLDEGGRHIFVAGALRTIGIHRDNNRHLLRVSGPGRFDPQEFDIPERPDALPDWSTQVVQATLEMLLA